MWQSRALTIRKTWGWNPPMTIRPTVDQSSSPNPAESSRHSSTYSRSTLSFVTPLNSWGVSLSSLSMGSSLGAPRYFVRLYANAVCRRPQKVTVSVFTLFPDRRSNRLSVNNSNMSVPYSPSEYTTAAYCNVSSFNHNWSLLSSSSAPSSGVVG